MSRYELGYRDHLATITEERERIRRILLDHECLPMHRDFWDIPIEDGGGRFACLQQDWRGNDLRFYTAHLLAVVLGHSA
jgi:hypothetical protein